MKCVGFLCAVLFAAAVGYGEVPVPAEDASIEVDGLVTFRRPGDSFFFIVDASNRCWRVNEPGKAPAYQVGDHVRVRGMRYAKDIMPKIEKAASEKIGTGRPPRAREMSVEEMYAAGDDGEPATRDWYGQVISVSGRIHDINRREKLTQILLGTKRQHIQVTLPCSWDTPLPAGMERGALVCARGVGVCASVYDKDNTAAIGVSSISILLDKAGDLRLLDPPPFWTVWSVSALVCGVTVLWFLVLGWIQRKRKLEKAAADATRRERLRLTSELHDNFQQLLAGCMFLLGAVQGRVEKGEMTNAKALLERLRASLNHTQAELRAALWGLTEEAEGPTAFTELFRYAAGRMPQWEGKVRFTVRGRERRVARQASGALLLILLEAVGNALRHGGADRIDVIVDFTEDALLFGVSDNGCGFEADAKMGVTGHLGIANMRRHAEGIGGAFTLTSAPGKGTTVTVRIPL